MNHSYDLHNSSRPTPPSLPQSRPSQPPSVGLDSSIQDTDPCLSGTKHELGSFSLPSFAEFARSSNYNPEATATGQREGFGYGSYPADHRSRGINFGFRTPPPLLPDYSQHSVKRRAQTVLSESVDHPDSPSHHFSGNFSNMFRDHLPGQAPSPRIDSAGSRNASPAPSWDSSSRNSSEDPATQPEQGMSWEAYAEVHKPNNGPTHFKCLWETTNNGKTSVCGYYAKKQLVKRHIETTHMKLKPYLCEYCGKAFPQKTSLDIHRSTHNGSRPHACHFDCGQTFRDPARRHKHHVDAHNYIPKQSKRNRRLDGSEIDQL